MLLGGFNRPQDVSPDEDSATTIAKLNENLQSIFDTIQSLINPEQSPVLRNGNLLDLDKNRLLSTDRRAKLKSVRELSDWIAGKSGIVVKDNGRGGVDISISSEYGSSSGSVLGKINYDEVVLTFTNGFMTQVVYNLGGALVETVNITWNAYGQPVTATSVVAGKTATISYLATGFPERMVIT